MDDYKAAWLKYMSEHYYEHYLSDAEKACDPDNYPLPEVRDANGFLKTEQQIVADAKENFRKVVISCSSRTADQWSWHVPGGLKHKYTNLARLEDKQGPSPELTQAYLAGAVPKERLM